VLVDMLSEFDLLPVYVSDIYVDDERRTAMLKFDSIKKIDQALYI
jgi:hypothetical protein